MSSFLDLQYLADMNLSPQTVWALQQDGLEIIRVSDVMPGTAKDRDILLYARQQDRVIITQDLDFSRLIAIAGYASPSLVTLRLSTSDPISITQSLRQILPLVHRQGLHFGLRRHAPCRFAARGVLSEQ